VVIRRPPIPGSTHRSLVADTIGRDSIQEVRIDDHLRVSRGRWGSAPGMRRRPFFGPRAHPASPEAGENGVGWAQLAVPTMAGTTGSIRTTVRLAAM
jgi:hypothetical protein